MKTLMTGTILAGLAFATPSMAGTISYHGYGMSGPESYITISDAPPADGNNHVIGAATIGQTVLHNTVYGDVGAWCIDLWDDLQGNGTYTVHTGTNLVSPATLGQIGALMAYAEKHPTGLVLPATQIAIWMLVYPDLVFWNETRDGTVAEANALLALDLTPVYGMQELKEPGNQTLLKAPEPLTLAILGTGLLGLALVRKRSASRQSGT